MRRHWERLPVAENSEMAADFPTGVPVKVTRTKRPVTPDVALSVRDLALSADWV